MRRPSGPMKRVLVCDDERHVVRLIQVNLERQGFEVTCGFNGREALQLLEANTFDIAIIDVMMPYVDGFEVLKWIRTHEETNTMKVVLMTAMADDRRIFTCPYEADLFFKKPFDPKDIWRL